MLKKITTALTKAVSFISARINKVGGLTKPCQQFFSWIFERWWMLPVNYNFLNFSRYGGYCEKAIRNQFRQKFPFAELSREVFKPLETQHCIVAYDPTHCPKSGKKTFGVGKFWSGTDSRVKPGVEVGCLAVIDVAERTAYALEAVQTPTANQIEHHIRFLTGHKERLLSYTDYLTVDGYFMKEGFVSAMLKAGLHVITKARDDANMRYLYHGPKRTGKGRKKRFAGKVDWPRLDRRRWKVFQEDEDVTAYELVVWSVSLKQEVKAIYVWNKKTESHAILVCTDAALMGAVVLDYYQLRFQIEFLIRDAKSHAGLADCQARSEAKLYNHFNLSLMSVSVMKWLVWPLLKEEGKERQPFSMRSVKTWFTNKYLTDTIFSKLGLELSCEKMKLVLWPLKNYRSIDLWN